MLISLRHKFVFLCMPKCASTSTERVLGKYAQLRSDGHPAFKHTTYRKYKKFLLPYIETKLKNAQEELEVLCLFREPIDWLNSWYRYRSRSALLDPNSPGHNNYAGNMTFYEFAEEYVSGSPRPFAKLGRQYKFICDKNGKPGDITVFPYEQYDKFISHMSSKIGENIKPRHANRSPKPGKDYDLEKLKFLKEYLKDEYEFYNSIIDNTRQ